ncbi:MAG: YcfA-like protein [Candidatus Methanolliviera sp. GoM_oil]|nr:MAG: YcfA-like protein [Candidatus Methanolliviera sp. GoM_oil]
MTKCSKIEDFWHTKSKISILPSLTARDVIKKLRKAGFVFDRQAKGSHEIWYNPITKRRTTIPNHPGVNIPKGTLKAIIKEAGLSVEKLINL